MEDCVLLNTTNESILTNEQIQELKKYIDGRKNKPIVIKGEDIKKSVEKLMKERKMNLPETINIMGVPFKVVYFKEISDVAPDKRSICFGHCELEKQEIRVWSGGAIEFTWQTLIHEMLHMIGDLTKISILSMDNIQKHNELDCLANVLTDVLIRNNLLNIQNKGGKS